MTLITAIGMLSPLGLDAAETTAALREGVSAALLSDTFKCPDGSPWLTAEVPPFAIADYLTPKAFLDRNSALFLAACASALRAGGLDPRNLRYGRAGIAAATVWGGLDTLDLFFADYRNKGPRLVKPLVFPHTYANTAVSLAAMEWALTGEHINIVSDRTAAGQAICEAVALIREGRADVMLAGGVDALGLSLLRALAEVEPLAAGADAPRLFSDSTGVVPSEAGVVLLLEDDVAARARGATPLARVYGAACAATAEEALARVLEQAGISADTVGFVVVSANGSEADAREAAAVRVVFGARPPPVTAPLGICGDLQGATVAFLAACAVLMGCGNFLTPIPEQPPCDGIDCVIGAARPCPPGPAVILTTSGANAVALILDVATRGA
jgi:3-oxoacyl-[acyl-carrier-protein] synthase II